MIDNLIDAIMMVLDYMPGVNGFLQLILNPAVLYMLDLNIKPKWLLILRFHFYIIIR